MPSSEQDFYQCIDHLNEFTDSFDDPRKLSHVRYPLNEVLFLCICSVLSGYESNCGIENFGNLKLEWLRKFYPYRNGVPTHERIGDIIGFLNKKAFELAFTTWSAKYFGAANEFLIHIDGKRLSNSAPRMLQDKKEKDGGQRPEAIVNAYASASGLVVAHNSISEHGDERRGAKEIIEQLHLVNVTLTGDSNFCDKDILKRIRSKGGHYIMALKKNNPLLYELAENCFADVRIDKMPWHTEQKGHGRLECRTYHAVNVGQLGNEKVCEYAGLNRIIRVRRQRTVVRKNKTSDETHYYITDVDWPIERIANAVRDHWRIENSLHWVLDVEYKEDESTKRSTHQAANFSLISKITLNMINVKRGRKSIKATRMACALSDQERENILELR